MYVPSDTLIIRSLSEATHTSQTFPSLKHMWHKSRLLMGTVADMQTLSIPIAPYILHSERRRNVVEYFLICSHFSFCPPTLHSRFVKFKSGPVFFFSTSNKVAAPWVQHRQCSLVSEDGAFQAKSISGSTNLAS